MKPPKNLEDLKHRALKASTSGIPAPLKDPARRALVAWIETASQHEIPLKDALRRLRDGEAAETVGRTALEPQLADPNGAAAQSACAVGCAFCCILNGSDGGTITKLEVERLHNALSPLAGEPDGRSWHPNGCPSLDPETQMCRVYDARPMICRTYISSDVSACESIAEGEAAEGAGVLGAQSLYLSVLQLSRSMLKGITRLPTYSLAKVAAGAVEGKALAETLDVAQHAPRELDEEIARQRAVIQR